MAGVGLHFDVVLGNGRPEAGPAGARIELGIRFKQRCPAAHALVSAGLMIVPVLARECRLGAFFARDCVLLGRQLFTPLFVGFLDLGHFEVTWAAQCAVLMPSEPGSL